MHVVATTAAVDPAALRFQENAHVVRFAAHDPLIRRASLVITHGGHGTVMRALSYGVNVVCLTGRAADQDEVAALDQPCVAAFIEEHGAGCRLRAHAPAADIRAAVAEVLGNPAYRRAALRAAGQLRQARPAPVAAQRLAALVPGRESGKSRLLRGVIQDIPMTIAN